VDNVTANLGELAEYNITADSLKELTVAIDGTMIISRFAHAASELSNNVATLSGII